MKWKMVLAGLLFSIFYFLLNGCKKELSCENCLDDNKYPVALAGKDTIIVMPTDSILLNGSSSYDPDGTIENYQWSIISGPPGSLLLNPSSAKAIIKTMKIGNYVAELIVTDNEGLSAKDSITIQVISGVGINHPPIANAGPDQVINLPVNSTSLNGSGSTDPDNNIVSYLWTKVSGPAAYVFTTASTVVVPLNNLLEGEYRFELKVTDALGLFSKDTMKLTVVSSITQPCVTGREQVPVQMIPIATLSQTRDEMVVVAAGNKILFAGGHVNYQPSSQVDIFNTVTNTWSTANLSVPRYHVATAVNGNSIFFAGGQISNGGSNLEVTRRVDVYNAASNSWTIDSLPGYGMRMTGAAANDKVVFAGGIGYWGLGTIILENVGAAIYNISTHSWTTAILPTRTNSEGIDMSATTVGNKIYFAGGAGDLFAWDFGGVYTDNIDIYDASNGTWSASTLYSLRGDMASISVNNKIFWAGGRTSDFGNTYLPTDEVEIRNLTTGISTFSCLFQPNYNFTAVQKNSSIIFFTKGFTQGTWLVPGTVTNKIDIFNFESGIWNIGLLPFNIYNACIISVNDVIYVAGGYVNGGLSNKVYKLEF